MVRTYRIPKHPSLAAATLFLLLTAPAIPCHAAIDETIPDAQAIILLDQRAAAAAPREQCYLHAELAHIFTELAGRQLLDGQPEQAAASLAKVEHYASLIHSDLAANARRIKDAEKLLNHTTHRLSDYIRNASSEDRPTLAATFAHLDHVHDELLNQVFAH